MVKMIPSAPNGDTIVVDGKGHLLGRLASTVAKQLLSGKKIVVVRCEQIVVSGSIKRNKVKQAQFLRKRHNTNPKKGPIHFKSPARMFWRTLRGMLPHKTVRGQLALAKLACHEGIPEPFDKMKRMVIPEALKVVRMKAERDFTVLKDLAQEFGWNYGPLVEKLEAQRQIKEQAYYAEKKANTALKAKAEGSVSLPADVTSTLAGI